MIVKMMLEIKCERNGEICGVCDCVAEYGRMKNRSQRICRDEGDDGGVHLGT